MSLPARPARDLQEPGDLRMGIHLGAPPVVEIWGEIGIQSAPQLRDELLRVCVGTGRSLPLTWRA